MKKSVGIITIVSNNYGNRLQNYALQESLKKMGLVPKTIPLKDKNYFQRWCALRIKNFVHRFIKPIPNITWDEFNFDFINWEAKSVAFHKEYLNKKYEYFIAGSDQIWNPYFEFVSDRELLTFTLPFKRIAYAASIGIDTFPKEHIRHYVEAWNKFRYISVREQAAADIIFSNTGKSVDVVLDPTMLLSEVEWQKFAQKSIYATNKKYCLKYFLGPVAQEYNRYIQNYAKCKNLEIMDVISLNKIRKKELSPIDFVKLICDSEAVFTDSFHGSVFSIIFRKPLAVFERPYQHGHGVMSSRLDTLMDTFHLESQRVKTIDDLASLRLEWNSESKEDIVILEKKRTEAIQLLKKALDI